MRRDIWEEASGIWVDASVRRSLGDWERIWEEPPGEIHLGDASGKRHLEDGIWEEASEGTKLGEGVGI